MMRGLGCPLATRGDEEGEHPFQSQSPWLSLTWTNDGWLVFGRDDRSFRRCIFTLWTNSSWDEWGFFMS